MNKSSMQNQSSTHEDGKIVDQAKQAVTHVASNVANQAKEQVNAQFDTRKDKAVETIGNVATAIRETGDKLKGVGPLGDVAGRAADGMEKVADFFEGKQIGDVVRDVERFARREPALFLGAAFALGLIGGRFLKSSIPRTSGPSNMGSSYARSGAGDYNRYESAYGSSFDDDQYDYLSDADLQDDIDSQRFGSSYGSQRAGRTTQPMGSRTGSSMSGSSMSGSMKSASSSQGSSFGATQGSPAGSSFGQSTGSGASSGSSGTSTTTTKTSSTPPATGSSSTSTSTSTSKNGIGGGSGNTGSV